RVGEREVVRALREAYAHRRNRDTPAVEDLEELLETLAALAEEVLLRDGAVFERELARVGGAPAELLHLRRDLVARGAVRNDQVGDLVVAGARGDRHAGGDVGARVGDEDLRAVDHPPAVAQLGGRAWGRRVGPGPGLGQTR